MKIFQSLRSKFFSSILVLLLTSLFAISIPVSAIEPNQTNPTTQQNQKNNDPKTENKSQTTTEKPETKSQPPKTETTETTTEEVKSCYDQIGSIGWLVCPGTGFIAQMTDSMYSIIAHLLAIEPLKTDQGSSAFLIWEYIRNTTNIIFIILLLVVVYSQITSIGFSNYNIKRTLPRIIIGVIMINLSFIICSLFIDLSNIVGKSLVDTFEAIQQKTLNSSNLNLASKISWSDLFGAISGGTIITGFVLSGIGLERILLAAIPVLLAVVAAVAVGLLTIALRQSLILLLVVISPLAFVAYLFPNTEKYFRQWYTYFVQMLVFYPLFSLLFGVSKLAGWTLITSSNNSLGVLFGMAIQVLPLFFAIPMLKMSSTVLGRASSFINNQFARPQAAIRNYLTPAQEAAKARHLAYSKSTGAHLQRYLEYRKTLREFNLEDNTITNKSRAQSRALYKLSGGYDIDNPDKILNTNRYTRERKVSRFTKLYADTYAMDADHSINNYGKYHNKTTYDQKLSDSGLELWANYNRALFTKVNDDEEDFKALFGFYDNIRKLGDSDQAYQKYITSAGDPTSILGQLLAKASAIESRKRKDVNLVFNKYGHNLHKARQMLIGYKNVDGWATDKDGNRLLDENGEFLEMYRGEIIDTHPERIVAYDLVDENGDAYYNMTDQKGDFVMRVYRKDSPVMKEILSNFDIPINDPINELYGLLTGRYEDPNNPIFKNIGLAKYSTTIGNAMDAGRYKEKAAYASPMVTSMYKNRYIKNFAAQNIARLNSLIKTISPSNFNTQDAAHFDTLSTLLNPDNLKRSFPEELIKEALDTEGKLSYGGYEYILDENGKIQRDKDNKAKVREIPIEEATYEQRLNLIKEKFLYPGASRFISYMSQISPETSDKQKVNTRESATKLLNVIDSYEANGLPNPYIQPKSSYDNAVYIKRKIKQTNDNQTSTQEDTYYPPNQKVADFLNNLGSWLNDYSIDEQQFADNISEGLSQLQDDYPYAAQEFNDYRNSRVFISKEQLYNKAIELLS